MQRLRFHLKTEAKKKSSFVTTHQSWSTFWLIVVFLMPTQYFKPTVALLTYKQLCGWSSGCDCSFRAWTALFFLLKLLSAVSDASSVCFSLAERRSGFRLTVFPGQRKKQPFFWDFNAETIRGDSGTPRSTSCTHRRLASVFFSFYQISPTGNLFGNARFSPALPRPVSVFATVRGQHTNQKLVRLLKNDQITSISKMEKNWLAKLWELETEGIFVWKITGTDQVPDCGCAAGCFLWRVCQGNHCFQTQQCTTKDKKSKRHRKSPVDFFSSALSKKSKKCGLLVCGDSFTLRRSFSSSHNLTAGHTFIHRSIFCSCFSCHLKEARFLLIWHTLC